MNIDFTNFQEQKAMKKKVISSMLFLLIITGSMEAQRIDYSPTVTEDERDLGIEQMTANEDVVYILISNVRQRK